MRWLRLLPFLVWCLLAFGSAIATETTQPPEDCSSFVLDNHGRHIFATNYDFSLERFCLAADRVIGFDGASTAEAVEFAFDSLREMYRPPYLGYTRWSIVFDIRNLRAYFRTQSNPEIRWVDLEAFDLRCGRPAMMLDMNENLSGDVSDSFSEFDADRNREFMEAYLQRWVIPYDPEALALLLQDFEGFPCIQTRRLPSRRAIPDRR